MKELEVFIVVDRSGSMGNCALETQNSIKHYIEELPENTLVTLLEFDTNIDFVYNQQFKNHVPEYNLQPRGMTRLFDAVGTMVEFIEERKHSDRDVVLVVLTDGAENSSKKYNKQQLQNIIKTKQDTENWLVIFMGADIDAFADGVDFGAKLGTKISYGKGSTVQAFAAVQASTDRYYRSRNLDTASFLDSERDEAK